MNSLPSEEIITAAREYGVAEDLAATISKDVHVHDSMFNVSGKPSDYLRSGAQALKAIQAAILLSQKISVGSILDFGGGHGRVGRWLRAAYPLAELTGAEILPSAVEFYGSQFNASGWLTKPNVNENNSSNQYDLIWAGSVITHLTEADSKVLIDKFNNWLRPDGIAVFSSHGRPALKLFRTSPPKRIEIDDFREAMRDFSAGNYGYANYTNEVNYGHSFAPLDWHAKHIKKFGRIVCLSEGGWNGFQDIVAFQKT